MKSIRIDGAESLKRALLALGDAAPRAAAGALFREAETIMTRAKALTPVLTGALKESGQVALPEVSGEGARVVMGFGNSAVGYAIFVHENLSARHVNGQAKFLEQPLNEARSGMAERLAADIRGEIARAGAH